MNSNIIIFRCLKIMNVFNKRRLRILIQSAVKLGSTDTDKSTFYTIEYYEILAMY